MCSLGIEPMTFFAAKAMLYHWATGTFLFVWVAVNTYTFLCVYDMRIWNTFSQMKRSWSGSQSSAGDVDRVFMSSLRRHACFSMCVVKENALLCHPFIQRYDRVIWVIAHHIRSCKSVENEYKLWFCVKKHQVNMYYQRMWADHSRSRSVKEILQLY